MKGKLSVPQSLNQYVYCRNNPHKYTDPDGRMIEYVIYATIGGTVVGMGLYAWGAYEGRYDFSAREFYRAGLEGAMMRDLLASGIIVSWLARGGYVVKTVVGGLIVVAECGVVLGVLGAYDVLTGEDGVKARERTKQHTESELNSASIDMIISVSDTPSGEDINTIDVALGDEFLNQPNNPNQNSVSMPTSSISYTYQHPPDYNDRPIIIPVDYIDASRR